MPRPREPKAEARHGNWSRRPAEIETGALLRAIALAHAAVGAIVYRPELCDIAEDGVLGAVPYRGARATAFWFLVPSPLLWVLGGLLTRAERAGEVRYVRSANRLGALTALAGAMLLPLSGFWGLLVICLRGMLRSHARA